MLHQADVESGDPQGKTCNQEQKAAVFSEAELGK